MNNNQEAEWKVAIDRMEQPPLQFWIDFGKFIAATCDNDDSDAFWAKIVRWADILQGRYNNTLANFWILKYLDALGRQST